jgi:hypothetical protein
VLVKHTDENTIHRRAHRPLLLNPDQEVLWGPDASLIPFWYLGVDTARADVRTQVPDRKAGVGNGPVLVDASVTYRARSWGSMGQPSVDHILSCTLGLLANRTDADPRAMHSIKF